MNLDIAARFALSLFWGMLSAAHAVTAVASLIDGQTIVAVLSFFLSAFVLLVIYEVWESKKERPGPIDVAAKLIVYGVFVIPPIISVSLFFGVWLSVVEILFYLALCAAHWAVTKPRFPANSPESTGSERRDDVAVDQPPR